MGTTIAKRRTWRTALSDDDSGYVELQAGLFRNQETYAFLEPQETVHFSEYWLPVRDLGGITRANVDAVLHMERPAAVARDPRARCHPRLPGRAPQSASRGQARARQNRQLVAARRLACDTRERLTDAPVTFELLDATGKPALVHTENTFDRTPASQARTWLAVESSNVTIDGDVGGRCCGGWAGR